MPYDKDQHERAIVLLRGSQGYRASALLSFVLSIAVVLGGIFSLEISREQRVISLLAVLYLISSAFTLAKTVRDKLMAKILGIPLLAGTVAWSSQCFISFWIAFAASVYAACTLDVQQSVRGFVLVGLSFALSSTISLAKLVRDRQDAEYFDRQPRNSHTYEKVVALCAGTHSVNGMTTWALFVVDLFAFFYALKDFHLNSERADFLSMGLIFMIYAALILAKAVRDSESKEQVLHPTPLHWTIYVAACLISIGLMFDTILRLMPLSAENRAFLSLNTICILSVTFTLAKNVRDRQEIEWQRQKNCLSIEILNSLERTKLTLGD